MADFTKLNGYTVKDPNAVHTYDTVADLKDDTKLKAGNHAQTKGYATAGDGGHATYIIVDNDTLVDDGGSVHDLENGLKAVLQIQNVITPELFGAYGDGIHDDTDAIQKAINICNNGKELSFANKTYLISVKEESSTALTVDFDNAIINGNGAKIKLASNGFTHYNVFNFKDAKNFLIKDITLQGDRPTHDYSTTSSTHEWGYGIFVDTDYTSLQSTENCYGVIDNVTIYDMTADAICTKNGYATGTIKVLNSELYNCRRQGISVLDTDTIIIKNTNIHDIGTTIDGIAGTPPTSGIDIEPASGTQGVKYVLVDDCVIDRCYRYAFVNANDNTDLIEIKNTKLGRPIQIKSNVVLDNVDLDFVDSSDYYLSGTDFGTAADEKNFKYSTITLRGANKQVFNGHHLHVKGVIIDDTWGANNAPKLPSGSNIYESIFEKMLITTGDVNTTINPSVLNGNKFISCQFHNSGNPLVFTDCTFIGCTKYSFNTSIQRTFINCYFDTIPDANMQYKGCFLLDGTAITDNI